MFAPESSAPFQTLLPQFSFLPKPIIELERLVARQVLQHSTKNSPADIIPAFVARFDSILPHDRDRSAVVGDARREFALDLKGKLQDCYEREVLQGMGLSVVLLLDLRDQYARKVCRRFTDEPETDEVVSAVSEYGVIPVAAWSIPADLAARLFADSDAELANKITERPKCEGQFNVVVIAEGGLSVVPMFSKTQSSSN